MAISVLISCMHQNDTSIVSRSNVRTNAVVVNQCAKDSVEESSFDSSDGKPFHLRFISTTERGLSRSRNMAIRNADDDICLIMDDDETLKDDYAETMSKAYSQYPEADVIIFKLDNSGKEYGLRPKRLGYLGVLKVASWQISFRRKSIIDNDIMFDVEMGSGTGHGAGEENAFLYECLHKGLKIQYVPATIASLSPDSASQWFKGFTPRFFLERGWATKRYMGKTVATLYALYYAVKKHGMYRQDCPMPTAIKCMLKGIYDKNALN